MTKFNDLNAAEICSHIRDILGGCDVTVFSEIQDGGDFLLVTVDIHRSIETEIFPDLKGQISSYMERKIKNSDSKYSWILNFEQFGAIVESITPS